MRRARAIACAGLFTACATSPRPGTSGAGEIRQLVPPDAIPPLDGPVLATGSGALRPDEPVLGLVGPEGLARAYPLALLERHVVVNDGPAEAGLVATYSARGRVAAAYVRPLLPAPREGPGVLEADRFGFSGAALKGNAILFDRLTRSLWTQLGGRAVAGPLAGRVLEPYPAALTTWQAFRALHPDAVAAVDPGEPLDVSDLAARRALLEGDEALKLDARLPPDVLVVGVIAGAASKAFALPLATPVNDKVGDVDVLIVPLAGGAAAFTRRAGGRVLTFDAAGEQLKDRETGSTWSKDGRAFEGPLAGKRLPSPPAVFAEWWAWSAFHPDTAVGR